LAVGQGGGSDISEADINKAINDHAKQMATTETSGHIYNIDKNYFTNDSTYGFSFNIQNIIDNKTIKLNGGDKLYCNVPTDYLPLSGGTMTGNIAFDTGSDNFAYLRPTDDKSVFGMNGGSSVYKGGFFRVYGIDEEKNNIPGGVGLYACDGEKIVTHMQVRNDGKAYVNNNEIFTTAGGTLKGNIGFDTGDDNFAYLYSTDQKSAFGINASPNFAQGGIIRVYGIDYKGNYSDTLAGGCLLQANDGEKLACSLSVRKDGKAYVNSKEIVCVESWRSGSSWYRKYADGFIEQMGQVSGYSENTVAVTFYCAMVDTSYYMSVTRIDSGKVRYDTRALNRTKTGAKIYLDNNSGEPARWYVCGFWK
jgi:hypothetical protein